MKREVIVAVCLSCSFCWALEDTNTVKAVAADEDAGWESVFSESNQIPLYINLYMKDGLYYEFMEKSEYDAALYTSIFSEKRRLTGRLGTRLHLDAAGYTYERNLDPIESGITVRSFDVNTYGRAFFLSPMTYGLEFGVSDGNFYLKNGYLWFHEVPYVKSVKLGFFKAPMSMSALQSSSGLMLMERPAPVTALAPIYKFGTQLGGSFLDQRATLYGGWFADGANSEYGDKSQSYSRFIGRATFLPNARKHKDDTILIHLGASASHMFSADTGVRYLTRPESILAPILVDTGDLGGDRAFVYGLEAAWVAGPWSIQVEGLGSFADDSNNSPHHFFGTYLASSLFLTGESKPYNKGLGIFSGITPRYGFSLRNGTWGAVELAGRFSYTDLTDGDIRGGVMAIGSGGLNWYFTHRHRLMFMGGYTDVTESANDGSFLFFQTRFQLEF